MFRNLCALCFMFSVFIFRANTCISSYKVKACFIISVFTVFIFGGTCLQWESFYVMCSIFLYKEPFYFFIICFELCVFCVLSTVCLYLGVTDSAVRVFMWCVLYWGIKSVSVFFMFLCFCVLYFVF